MTNKIRILWLAFLGVCMLGLPSANAQYNELGIQFGLSRYKGELSPHLFDLRFIHLTGGVFYRHNWNRHWSWKLEVNYGKVSGDDAALNTAFEQNRNLNFYSTILEASPAIEFNFFPYETGNSDYPFTPYLFTGITVFKFNPKSTLNGQAVELQPLGTEGQGLSGRPDFYHRVAIAIPIGGGIKVSLGSVGMGLQVTAHRTYTDYLDDVSTTYPDLNQLQSARGSLAVELSDPGLLNDTLAGWQVPEGKQRGISSDKDWYVFGTLTIYVRLTSFVREFCKPFKRKRYH